MAGIRSSTLRKRRKVTVTTDQLTKKNVFNRMLFDAIVADVDANTKGVILESMPKISEKIGDLYVEQIKAASPIDTGTMEDAISKDVKNVKQNFSRKYSLETDVNIENIVNPKAKGKGGIPVTTHDYFIYAHDYIPPEGDAYNKGPLTRRKDSLGRSPGPISDEYNVSTPEVGGGFVRRILDSNEIKDAISEIVYDEIAKAKRAK